MKSLSNCFHLEANICVNAAALESVEQGVISLDTYCEIDQLGVSIEDVELEIEQYQNELENAIYG